MQFLQDSPNARLKALFSKPPLDSLLTAITDQCGQFEVHHKLPPHQTLGLRQTQDVLSVFHTIHTTQLACMRQIRLPCNAKGEHAWQGLN